MIYVSGSLSIFIKKAFGDKAFQTSIDKIVSVLHLDPATSDLDLAVVASKDLRVVKIRNEFIEAMKTKHPDVDVLCIYEKGDTLQGLDKCGCILREVRKANLDSVEDAVKTVLESRDISKRDEIIISKDSITPVQEEKFATIAERVSATLRNDKKEIIEKQEIAEEEEVDLQLPEEEEVKHEVVVEEIPEHKVQLTLEERVKACGEFADWGLFKQLMKKDAIVRELLTENNKFYGTVNMMTALEKKILNVFKDVDKTPEDRFDEIVEFGLQRTAYRETQNNIITEKVVNVMTIMAASAQETVKRRIDEFSKSLFSFKEQSTVFYKKDKEKLQTLIEDRINIQISIDELIKEIITLYTSMDATVAQVIDDFDKDLPSENDFINEVYKTAKPMFSPANMATLSSRLRRDLQQNRINLSVLENQLNELVALVFSLCEADDVIIEQQSKLIQLLEANNVEDVVIVDTILKNCLRLFIGPNDTGTRSTAITWSGILARRHNTLLIDLTGQPKFSEYGLESVSLNDFMSERVETSFLCVDGNIGDDMEYLSEVIRVLKTRLEYYPYVNIILNTDQIAMISELSESALSATFITDCTNRANMLVRNAMMELKLKNTAKKVVMIDAPQDALPLLTDITGDPLTVKLIPIPHLTVMKNYSHKAIPPYRDPYIVEIFESAFR
jgi:hypothetical protein